MMAKPGTAGIPFATLVEAGEPQASSNDTVDGIPVEVWNRLRPKPKTCAMILALHAYPLPGITRPDAAQGVISSGRGVPSFSRVSVKRTTQGVHHSIKFVRLTAFGRWRNTGTEEAWLIKVSERDARGRMAGRCRFQRARHSVRLVDG